MLKTPFAVIVLAVLMWEAVTLWRPTSIVHVAGRRPYVIDGLALGEPIGQTFRILDSGLNSVNLQLWAERPASLDIACRLLGSPPHAGADGGGAWAVIYAWKVTLQLPRGRSSHHFSFPPILRSEKQIYQFQIEQLGVRSIDPTEPGRPAVGVMASRDDSLPEGNMVIGTRQVPNRDLFFGAQTTSSFNRFRLRANPLMPRLLGNLAVQIGLLALYNAALIVFALHMVVLAPEQSDRDQQPPFPS